MKENKTHINNKKHVQGKGQSLFIIITWHQGTLTLESLLLHRCSVSIAFQWQQTSCVL